jgi:hypothetical protein
MSYDYPTEEQLKQIMQWDYKDFHGLMAVVEGIWAFPERGWIKDGDIYTLITSGWSGNEEIIAVLRENMMFWVLYWESSTRGGKHVFMPLTFKNITKRDGK